MTNPEHPSHGPPHSEESITTVTRRYSPLGNREMLAKLKSEQRIAVVKAAIFAPSVDDNIKEIFFNNVSDYATDDPATAYQKAVDLHKNYGDAIRAEEELADDFLTQLAEPYMVDPPQEEWGIVRGVSGDGAVYLADMRVPFTQSEIEAINVARKARQMILSSGQAEGRATRDFWMDSHLFPSDTRLGPFLHSLTSRPYAIWGIWTAARAAEDALTLSIGTASEPKGNAARLYATVRDLPDKLIRHKPVLVK